eukprot:2722795-Pyramimonas_sp.AAC.1
MQRQGADDAAKTEDRRALTAQAPILQGATEPPRYAHERCSTLAVVGTGRAKYAQGNTIRLRKGAARPKARAR